MQTEVATKQKKEYSIPVDEFGRSPHESGLGRFGENLKIGDKITVDDNDDYVPAEITEIGTYIHTNTGGGANFVWVTATREV